jgi:hypothetical protein
MDNFITGQLISGRASVKTGLAVCLAESEHQNLLITIGEALGPVKKPRMYYSAGVVHHQRSQLHLHWLSTKS